MTHNLFELNRFLIFYLKKTINYIFYKIFTIKSGYVLDQVQRADAMCPTLKHDDAYKHANPLRSRVFAPDSTQWPSKPSCSVMVVVCSFLFFFLANGDHLHLFSPSPIDVQVLVRRWGRAAWWFPWAGSGLCSTAACTWATWTTAATPISPASPPPPISPPLSPASLSPTCNALPLLHALYVIFVVLPANLFVNIFLKLNEIFF